MKKDFVILMGSDGSGKSTIADALKNELGYNIHHFGPPKNFEDGRDQYFNFVENTEGNVICDRFHEGEAIFAPLYREYEAKYFTRLEKELMEKFNVLLVLVHAQYSVILNRIEERGEDFVKPEHMRYVYEKTTEVWHESSLPKIVINTDFNTPEKNVEKILEYLG